MAPPQHVRRLRFQDPDAFRGSFRTYWNELAFLEAPPQRPFDVGYRCLQTSNLFLMELQTSGYRFGFAESDFVFLGVPLSSGIRSFENDATCGNGSVVVYGRRPFHLAFGDERTTYRGFHFGVRRSALRAWYGIENSSTSQYSPGAPAVFPIAQVRGLMAGLQRVVPFIAPGAACAADFAASVEVEEQAMQSLLETSLGQQIACLPESVPRAGEKPVRRAVDFIRAGSNLPISSQDIANAAGVGLRSLQISFRQAFGKSPWQYLTDCRLDAARASLSDPDKPVSVTMAALEAGFSHLGEFSRRYYERFGEKPVETRRRIERDAPARAASARVMSSGTEMRARG